jgi:DNA-binding NarL/FixJ family response regulator
VALAEALPAERVALIELAPLGLEDGIELAVALDGSLDPARAGALYEKAQGSPFWLEALVRTGGEARGPGRLLTVRLRGAGSDAGWLLGLLAVAGRPVGLTDAVALADWPLERVEAALGELVSRGIAIEIGGAARLTHDLIREAAFADLPDDARRQLHRRLAERLELAAGADLGILREALEHRQAAGMPTLNLATRLARSPRRTLLGPEGARLLATIADEADPFDAAALALHEEVASLATEIAWHEEALARWLRVAESPDPPLRRASALLAASRAAYALERPDEAGEYLARSREIDVGDAVLDVEQRTHEAAIRLWLEQRTAEGRALARDAVAAAVRLAARLGGVETMEARARRAYIDALRLDSEAALQEGDAQAMLGAAKRREAAARGLDVESYLTAAVAVGAGFRLTGHVREAIARLRRVWADAHRYVLPRLAVDAGYWLGRSLQFAGELVEAEQVVHETAELAARTGDVPRGRHRIARVACSLALERREPREALRRLEREVTNEPNGHQRIAFHLDVALWKARLDGPEAASVVEEQLKKARECADAAGCPRCTSELVLFSVEALARIGARAAARRALARWDGLKMQDDAVNDIVRLHVEALAEVDAAARVAGLEAVLAAANRSAYALESLWIQLDLGRALAETDSKRAVGELERTADAARERGARTVQELSEHALRSLGVRTWRRGGAGAPLTRREEEVARLVADGATNREIAQALFLSPKTVERHVSNVLKKIGARNRTELAARLGDRGGEYAGTPR